MSEQDESLPPMEDYPSSPPSLPSRPHTLRPSLSRKRIRASELSSAHPSSDPAFFSSDDGPDETVEHYERGGRPKKYVRGAWYDRARADDANVPIEKKGFSRNFDSGVWMGSDSTEGSADPASSQEQGNEVSMQEQPEPHRVASVIPTFVEARDASELEAERIINLVLEKHSERVDLSGLNLTNLSNRTLRPLRLLVCYAKHLDTEGSSPREYDALIPRLQLFLSSNALTRLPNEIFNLDNLTVLSLRNNNLTELPPSISRLENLVELNVSGNHLRWLPYELLPRLGLGIRSSLRRLTVLPNPFAQAIPAGQEANLPHLDVLDFVGDAPSPTGTTRGWPLRGQSSRLATWIDTLGKHLQASWKMFDLPSRPMASFDSRGQCVFLKIKPIFVAASPVIYLDNSGLPQRLGAKACSDMSDDEIRGLFDDPPPPPPVEVRSPVPSLLELSLQECCSTPSLSHIHSLMPPDAPSHLLAALSTAQTVKETGGKSCSICGRDYIMPRTEWLEYHHYVPDALKCSFSELWIPFLRRGCSWQCTRETEVV